MTSASKPPRWAYLLIRLIRETRPASVIEMGACVGISAAYEAAALELNRAGRLVSLEGSDVLARRSQQTLDELNLGRRGTVRLGHFGDTLGSTVRDLRPIGFAFIDGHHVETATLDYIEQLLRSMGPESVLVYDDIAWSDGMRRAWSKLEDYRRFALTVDLGSTCIAVVSATATSRSSLRIYYG